MSQDTNQQTQTSEQQNPQGTSSAEQQTQQQAPSEQQTNNNAAGNATQTDLGSEEAAKTSQTDLGSDDEGEAKPGEAAADKFADFRGPPETGKYEAFQLPDGAEADPEIQGQFEPLVAELGLSQKGAQKLVDFKTKLDQKAIKDWGAHVEGLREIAKSDPQIGGAKYAESVSLGKAAIAKFGSPALRAVLNHYGVGAHPEMIRFMANVGRAMKETPSEGNGGNAGGDNSQKPLHDVLYTHPSSQPQK